MPRYGGIVDRVLQQGRPPGTGGAGRGGAARGWGPALTFARPLQDPASLQPASPTHRTKKEDNMEIAAFFLGFSAGSMTVTVVFQLIDWKMRKGC